MTYAATGVLATVLLISSCHRHGSYYVSPPIDGLRFVASARLTGVAGDSLLVQVTARNDANAARTLESGTCGDELMLRAYHVAGPGARRRAPAWDSVRWRRATEPADAVCIGGATGQRLAPHVSRQVGALVVPIRVVLGDSLPAGRYRLTARLIGNGWRAGELPAGEVEFRMPRTQR